MKLSTKLIASLILTASSVIAATNPPAPAVEGNVLYWDPVPGATAYNIHAVSGAFIESVHETSWKNTVGSNSYFVVATDSGSWQGWGRSQSTYVPQGVSSPNQDPAPNSGSTPQIGAGILIIYTAQRHCDGYQCTAQCLIGEYVTGGACGTADHTPTNGVINGRNYVCTTGQRSDISAQAICMSAP